MNIWAAHCMNDVSYICIPLNCKYLPSKYIPIEKLCDFFPNLIRDCFAIEFCNFFQNTDSLKIDNHMKFTLFSVFSFHHFKTDFLTLSFCLLARSHRHDSGKMKGMMKMSPNCEKMTQLKVDQWPRY